MHDTLTHRVWVTWDPVTDEHPDGDPMAENLPKTVDIPADLPEDVIPDYLSDEYHWLVLNWGYLLEGSP